MVFARPVAVTRAQRILGPSASPVQLRGPTRQRMLTLAC